ncbi:1,4-alpha-glucan branching enzyme GlgB [Alteromonas sp. KUL42]|uniref:1,4-alpha-glucan branching protein GlgB n=1 Tax=Alteromonas sp. KUL42 TaxID=2480797 RepID=UPI0010361F20|nr:1,4-alpha-glucan branching protein GlgB [Alteromonas sp. KUL42]TAP37100.1 1,4-alpha-glucan branching protein GlgB [Alteromonas sp. KUL42]GEA06516.1 1,4-alpha-glucan branching enzyme GlgB [Alteromonas sp. KUL42]
MQLVQQLEHATCSQPFTQLGMVDDNQALLVRVWRPGATSVTVKWQNPALADISLNSVSNGGLFEIVVAEECRDEIYQVIASDGAHQFDYIDPYQFKDAAYHAVHFIDTAPENLYKQAGAQLHRIETQHGLGIDGVRFCVFAPNASAVSVIGDFNQWDGRVHPMQKTSMGYWVLFVPGVAEGERYKYQVKDAHGHDLPHKADPLGFSAEQYPSHASKIYNHSSYEWNDSAWMASRDADKYSRPMSIYEVHLGSWKRPDANSDVRYLSYRELADDLIGYVSDMGYTHLELLPVSEFPFDGSWGYQPVGMFAPTSRFGNPDDFKYFVDKCHQAGIGVIIDWVPAHFPEDGHGLARFDGSCVYEYEDPRKGWHPDWNSCIYDFGKDTVRQFLVANALFWLDKFHVDGLRVDAVASMLYLDYSRNDGEWIPNVDGGNENYEAISLLRWMNEEVYKHFPDAMTIAEESTSFPKVSRPVFDGGLGFGFKWNMGWMHDSLHYIARDPAYRNYHHGDITFSMVYAFDENFVLPISHDEVVHGKGSMLHKMPGDEWQQAANLRCYAGFMYGHPGKKLNFMGNELGQSREWNHDSGLDWDLLNFEKHAGIQALYKALNHLYRTTSALHEQDHQPQGFTWIDHNNAEQSVVSFVRNAKTTKQKVYVISNFTPIPRDNFRIGVDDACELTLALNTDDAAFWGSGYSTLSKVKSSPVAWNDRKHSIVINLPPLSTVFYVTCDA